MRENCVNSRRITGICFPLLQIPLSTPMIKRKIFFFFYCIFSITIYLAYTCATSTCPHSHHIIVHIICKQSGFVLRTSISLCYKKLVIQYLSACQLLFLIQHKLQRLLKNRFCQCFRSFFLPVSYKETKCNLKNNLKK